MPPSEAFLSRPRDTQDEWLVEVPSRPWYFFAKRAVDLVVSSILLLLLLPLGAFIGVAIKLDSPGSVLFCQRRTGKQGRPFTILKFRSMTQLAPSSSTKVPSDDPRVTRVGRLLRLSGLDELPQLVNVLRGDMALIGPRPELSDLMNRYAPWQRQRHLVTPGITGWWQVHHRNEIPMHTATEFDLYYICHMGVRLDLEIAARTVVVMARGSASALRRRQPHPPAGVSGYDSESTVNRHPAGDPR